MKKTIIYFLFFLFLLSFQFAVSQDKTNVTINLNFQEPLEVKPGEIVSLPVMVKNFENSKRSCRTQVRYPKGLKLLSKDDVFQINPSDSTLILFTFQVSKSALADTSIIEITVDVENGVKLRFEKKIGIFVRPRYELIFKTLTKPSFVNVGGSAKVDYSVTNKSNKEANVTLLLDKDKKDELYFTDVNMTMLPGETKYFSVAGNIFDDRNLQNNRNCNYTITGEIKENGELLYSGKKSDNLVIYPYQKIDQEYYYFDNNVTLRGIKDKNLNPAFQVDVIGSLGYIPFIGSTIRYFVRTPDLKDKTNLFYYRDNYNVDINSKHFDLSLGDDMYMLSDATESGTIGFGAKTKLRVSDFELNAFQQKDRLNNSGLQEMGGSVFYKIGDNIYNSDYSLGVNFLNKKFIQTNNIYSFTGTINKYNFARLKVEYAKDDNTVSQSAYNFTLNGFTDIFNYNVNYRHSSPQFRGYSHDVNYLQSYFNLIPIKEMSIYSFYNSYRFNIDSDPTKAAPHNINYGTAFNFNLSKYNLFAFAKYNYFLWEDALSNIGTSEKLNDMSVGVSYIDKNFLISSMAEFYLYDKSGDMPSYQYKMCDLTLGYNFNTGQKLQASLDYYMYDKSIIFKNFDNRLQARFSADVPVTSSTKFKFLFTTSNLLKNNKLYNYNNSYADASLEQYLMWNHLLILSARYYDYGNSYLKNNYAVMAEYRIPIKIPTWKKERPMISITGRLYDAENPETGMSGVTLYADGKSAVTDNKGFYEFENMKPDVYYLELNRLTLAPGKTTVQKTPIEISIKAGEEARVDIGIIRSASILGKVMLYDFEEKNKLDTTLQNIKESFGLPDFQIYMHNGRPDLYTAASDSRGKFEFRDLPPGHWVVKIIEGNYPDYHYLETDSASFNLVAGEKKELTFRILPRVRPIKIAVRTDTIKTEEELKPPVEITPKIPLSIGVAHRFNYDGWTDSLDAMTRSYLNDVAQYIKDNKNFVVSIEGHTDNIGGIAVTQQLSIQKAQLMRNYLIKKGVPSGNILTQGLGSRRPIAPNTTPQGRSRNRRVEITIKRK